MPARIPKLPTQTGDYAVQWFLDDRVIPGELSLEPNRPPHAALYGDVVAKDWSFGGRFPEDHTFDRVVGRMRSGQDVVLTDAELSIWFPERSSVKPGDAQLGFAEHRLGKAASKLQLEDLDASFIGAFLDHLEADRSNSIRTRNARLAAIHSFFRYAALRHPEHAAMIERVLAVPPKRFERHTVSFLNDAFVAEP